MSRQVRLLFEAMRVGVESLIEARGSRGIEVTLGMLQAVHLERTGQLREPALCYWAIVKALAGRGSAYEATP